MATDAHILNIIKTKNLKTTRELAQYMKDNNFSGKVAVEFVNDKKVNETFCNVSSSFIKTLGEKDYQLVSK